MRRSGRVMRAIGVNTAILVVVCAFAFPVLWTLLTSLKPDVKAWSLPPVWVFRPTLKNYYSVLVGKNVGRFLANSAVVASGSTALALLTGVPAAYVFARYPVPFQGGLLFVILMAYIVPGSVVCLPLYTMAARINALNSYPLLIAAHGLFNMAFTVWMMTGFFQELPREMEESAQVDGCTPFGALLRVVLPLSAPSLAATTIFCFVLSWNDFLYSLILSGFETRTVPVGLTQFLTPHGLIWGELCATAILAILPPAVLAALVQRHMIKGLVLGAIK